MEEEHVTTVVNLTSQQDLIIREKFTRQLRNSDTENYRTCKHKREDKGARFIVASNTSSNTEDDDFFELKENGGHKVDKFELF
ncbi:hypothetical protein C1646_777991 [Rhizophagus diaphanus]|nr:hypothetical protein C1646_777991 [Rhizophagus diaphanus] [Rhizophagus sp. MUCL 43196]